MMKTILGFDPSALLRKDGLTTGGGFSAFAADRASVERTSNNNFLIINRFYVSRINGKANESNDR
jgi:hypothetical protein